jgi:hypothetical protein
MIFCAPPTRSTKPERNRTPELVAKVVLPALLVAEQEFGQALSRISLDDMVHRAALQWRRNGSPRQRRRASRRLVGRSILADSMAATLLQSSSHPTGVAAPKLYRNKQHAGCCPNVRGRRSITFHGLAKVRPERSSGRCDRADQRRNAGCDFVKWPADGARWLIERMRSTKCWRNRCDRSRRPAARLIFWWVIKGSYSERSQLWMRPQSVGR